MTTPDRQKYRPQLSRTDSNSLPIHQIQFSADDLLPRSPIIEKPRAHKNYGCLLAALGPAVLGLTSGLYTQDAGYGATTAAAGYGAEVAAVFFLSWLSISRATVALDRHEDYVNRSLFPPR